MPGNGVLDLVLAAAQGVALAGAARLFVIGSYQVSSESMRKTIREGDRLLGEKLSRHTGRVEPGCIVTFRDPEDPHTTLVKRVIAVGGQVVELRDDAVVVDGAVLDEPYTRGRRSRPSRDHADTLAHGVSYPYAVPEGHLWVMGDNRTRSLDSRYFGAVPVSSVTSRIVGIVWPPRHARRL